ncbi:MULTISPECIES: translation initiation factor IF-5A [Desulfurococcus]|jgi:translation initiation factor 5A|uniref:Translation initiation factor 5A n=2 Tax=Desulfurococcus amylolyticus TaxID=94694 RepID=IF5A_DESA1|nr:translation initiation factor IF-5A [Desulfurococcus amylolyticus]B8D4W8.1 RecName: Full=Translation initiation factor 5A; AltName: Full=Hypusine-containing protein; AltName: Full=eIF-5A [Desulfurococcus amylolyticus 1221n]ACL11149.1 translation initiation factor IF-5A [Desulfurococcus amylolyticus 1221n]AFL66840.1 translation initiation factor 5A precursor (eIF-5A) [Desulfurococcus amylolyticus DSM 16532]
MSKVYDTLGNLKVGSFIVIDGEPCRIVEMSRAKTGKHGSAKANVVAIGLFSKAKKTLVAPVDTQVEVPVIEKHVGQIIADMGTMYQVMDMETYETFEVEKDSIEEDIRNKLGVGSEVEYWVVMGKRLIIRPR